MGKLREYNNEIIIGHNVGPSDVNSTLYAIKVSASTIVQLLLLNCATFKTLEIKKSLTTLK